MAATDEVRDAHHRARRWAHMLTVQVDRLYAARAAAIASTDEVRRKAYYGHEDSLPFFVMEGDAHFVMTAARQLLRSLRAFDGNDRLPAGMDDAQLRDLRDALEHWDEPQGRAARHMQARGADPKAHRWSYEGPGVLGGLISDAALRAWGQAVYDELILWDPW